ncbi:MAG: putative rane protein [Rhizobacter sp.]|nr:putative rane protein [Rhizobacter sp.]
MHPAFSIIVFTTLAGAAQGLAVVLALAELVGLPVRSGFMNGSLLLALFMLVVGLGASFMHLGRPERAWRAVLMWRTSWMSREVIVLPAFIGIVAVWWLSLRLGVGAPWDWVLPLLVIVGAAALWYCTAMIYACLRFIQEWATPLTIVNYTLVGLSSGFVLTSALAAATEELALLYVIGPLSLFFTLVAWFTRSLAWRRNRKLKHKSTLQSATGIKSPKLVQKSMGMSAGAFNTREFFHGATLAAMRQVKLTSIVLGFGVPSLLLLIGVITHSPWPMVFALVAQAPGLVADRWFFFAQAKHPQNLYYQVVS